MLRLSAKLTILPVLCLLMGAAPFQAKKWTAEATADPEIGMNRYLVEFPPELGGEVIEMSILSGTYTIGFNTTSGRATLIKWEQEVSAIEIMGMSTGPITISLQPDTVGRGLYEPDGGAYRRGYVELVAVFRIEFDDSEFVRAGLCVDGEGLCSPFIMPAFESGTIHADGVLSLTADGVGEIEIGDDSYPLTFFCIATTKIKKIELN